MPALYWQWAWLFPLPPWPFPATLLCRDGSEFFINCAVHRHRKRIQSFVYSTNTGYLFKIFCIVDPVLRIHLLKNGQFKRQLVLYNPALAAQLIAVAGSVFLSSKNACLPIFYIPFLAMFLKKFLENFFLCFQSLWPCIGILEGQKLAGRYFLNPKTLPCHHLD